MTNHHPPSGSFFSGLIDYAGLFPPAALGLSDAVKNYSDYQRSSERWILSRFIGATPHILALTEELLSPFSVSSPLEVSLVTKDPAADLPKVLAHGEALGGRFVVRALEVALPCVEDVAAIAPGITEAALPVLRCPIFFELGAGVEWEEHLTKLLDAIHTLREARHEVGFKLRCGGVEPQQIPPPARVAHALFESAARSLPMK
ncbi:MAG: hypothetical protein RL417_2294, partial [Pseudomonadota bacterium]